MGTRQFEKQLFEAANTNSILPFDKSSIFPLKKDVLEAQSLLQRIAS